MAGHSGAKGLEGRHVGRQKNNKRPERAHRTQMPDVVSPGAHPEEQFSYIMFQGT